MKKDKEILELLSRMMNIIGQLEYRGHDTFTFAVELDDLQHDIKHLGFEIALENLDEEIG